MQLDAVIFGGGAAGLWLLDELRRRGCSALLLEAHQLGSGQTVASQGILHGGLKYTLQGLLTPSAAAVREMPAVWRDCLAGNREPRLTGTKIRSDFCYLWRTETISSRLGMIGAKFGLRVAPQTLPHDQRPNVLSACPGTVARLEEQVIAPADFVADLAQRNREYILKIDADRGLEFECNDPGCINGMRLTNPQSKRQLELRPRHVIFTAGAGNAMLREKVGLSEEVMQRRGLQMVMLRGEIPALNGHCVDGAKTRVTITSDVDSAGRTVWQIGGQIAEEGVHTDAPALISAAGNELEAVLPGLNLDDVEWGTYRVDRAEGKTPGGKRPETVQVLREGNVITAWPAKLVLAPRLADEIANEITPQVSSDFQPQSLSNWPRPEVALPPWETCRRWYRSRGINRSIFRVKKCFAKKAPIRNMDLSPFICSRPLGKTGLPVSPLGYGAFKIGRNQKIKYPQPYDLPDEKTVDSLLNSLLDLGIHYLDTAPAYGLSEERIGNSIAHRRREFVLSTKVGETFADGVSNYDFSAEGIRHSVHRSLERLKTDVLDLVFLHSDGNDLSIQNETDAVPVLTELKQEGLIKAIGLSGKTVEGARQSLAWADAIMVEYHLNDRSHEEIIKEAAGRGIGVIVKKGLAAGYLDADEAIRFVLGNRNVSSLIVGGLNLDHIRSNLAVVENMAEELSERRAG